MKQEERLLNALTNISDELVEDAARKPKRIPWRQLTAIAACAAVVIGIASNLGGGGGGGGDVSNESLSYDSYIGPVLPLTVLESAKGLAAERAVTYDFSSYGTVDPDHPHAHADVTDSYVLTNTTSQDMTFNAVYPFTGSFSNNADFIPTIAVNGTIIEADFVQGGALESYTDNFVGSAEIITEVLSDGSYFAEAFSAFPELAQPVTVYRISDVDYDGPVGDNPTLAFEFSIDSENTKFLTYNAPGFGYMDKTRLYSVTVNRASAGNNQDSYVVLLGEDIDGYSLQGYSTGTRKEENKVDGFTAQVTRHETTLGAFLWETVDWDEWRTMYDHGLKQCIGHQLTAEELFGCTARFLTAHGAASIGEFDQVVFLEDYLSSVVYQNRVLYLTFDLTIPAGQSVTVGAQMIKDASTDHFGKKTQDRDGYDLMTTLNSRLTFTKQTASVSNVENVDFLDQNFGFDPENGVITVELDLSQDHYWMNVRNKYD